MTDKPSVIVLTPIMPGELIAPGNLSYPRLVSEMAPISSFSKDFNININWYKLQRIFVEKYQKQFEYVALVDSDVIINDDLIHHLLKNWKEHFTPCIRTKSYDTKGHIIAACSLMHRDDFIHVKYHDGVNTCPCVKYPNTFYIEGVSTSEIK